MWLWILIITFWIINLPLLWYGFRKGLVKKTRKITITLGTIILAMPILIIPPFLGQPRIKGGIYFGVGVLLMVIGSIIGLIARLEFWRYKIPLWPNGWTPPRFAKTGIYYYIRHPMYLGGSLFYIGYNLAWGAIYALYFIVPLFIAFVCFRGYLEERYVLEPKFGEEYREYQRRTGMFLPFIGKRKA